MTYNHNSLSQKEPDKRKMIQMAQKLTLKRNYNPRRSRKRLCDVRAFQFLLPAFESGFLCSRNGGPHQFHVDISGAWSFSQP